MLRRGGCRNRAENFARLGIRYDSLALGRGSVVRFGILRILAHSEGTHVEMTIAARFGEVALGGVHLVCEDAHE